MMINNNCNRFGKFRCKIVLSGGPCAGKTTTITKLAETIYNDKWQIFTVAEAVSLLKMGGVHRSQLNQDQLINWQNDLLLTICQLEDVYDNIAKNENKRHTMIICDRGAIDAQVYTTSYDEWNQILQRNHLNETDLLRRYHTVVHMRTAPLNYYSQVNNIGIIRGENYEEAIRIDDEYAKVWSRHENYYSVDNSAADGFNGKFQRVQNIVENVMLNIVDDI